MESISDIYMAKRLTRKKNRLLNKYENINPLATLKKLEIQYRVVKIQKKINKINET